MSLTPAADICLFGSQSCLALCCCCVTRVKMMSKIIFVLTVILFISQVCQADEKANLENVEQSEQCKVKNDNGSEVIINELKNSLRVSIDEQEKLQSELSLLNSSLQQFLCAFDTTAGDILDICNDIHRNKCKVRCCDVHSALKMMTKHLVQASTMLGELLANLSECKDFTHMRFLENEKKFLNRILENPSSSILSFVEAGNVKRLRSLFNSIPVNVNDRSHSYWTLLTIASIKNHTEIVKLLLQAGAKVDDLNLYNISSILDLPGSQTLLHAGRTLRLVNCAHATALIVAAYANNTEVCRILLEAGAALDVQNEMGFTALIYATQNGNLGLLKMLLDKGASVQASTKEVGDTALHIAASLEGYSVEVLKLLVSRDANINAKNKKGETPLALAWEYRNRDAFTYLLKLGAEE